MQINSETAWCAVTSRLGGPLVRKAAVMIGVAILASTLARAQTTDSSAKSTGMERRQETLLQNIFSYLNMAGTRSADFRPLTQRERNTLYGKSFINPLWYLKGAVSAGQNQWKDDPREWEQGISGYGKRYGDIMGQYAIRRTITYGFESWFHEDNRYLPSGKKGFWPRTGYALSSGIMARHDNGRRYPSASLLVGYAGGAYLSRFWQPDSVNSVGDAAVSFGVSMGWNIGFSVMKEYLPDILRRFTRRATPSDGAGPPPAVPSSTRHAHPAENHP
jgi:hypothetical protein